MSNNYSDPVHGIVITPPNLELRNLFIRAIAAASQGSLKPAIKSNSDNVNRAIYSPAMLEVIVNNASEHMHNTLGRHRITRSVVVRGGRANREVAADRMAKVFTDAGYEATVHTQAEPSFPNGFLIFVSVPTLDGIMLMIWPERSEVSSEFPPEVLATLPARSAWTDEDLNSEA